MNSVVDDSSPTSIALESLLKNVITDSLVKFHPTIDSTSMQELQDVLKKTIKDCKSYQQRQELTCLQKYVSGVQFVHKTLGYFAAILLLTQGGHDSNYEIVLKTENISRKVGELVKVIQQHHNTRPMGQRKCVVVVRQRIVAESLALVFKSLNEFESSRIAYIFGFKSLNAPSSVEIDLTKMEEMLDGYLKGQIDILFATNAIQDRVDLPECHLFIDFDDYYSRSKFPESITNADTIFVRMVAKSCKLKRRHDEVANNNEKQVVRDSKKSRISNDLDLLLEGYYDIPIHSKKCAMLYPSGSTWILNWFANSNNFVLEYKQIWPSDSSWCEILILLKNNWSSECVNVGEIEVLDAIPETDPTRGYVYSVEIQGFNNHRLFLGSLRHSKRQAKYSAAFAACKYLHAKNYLNESLIPFQILPDVDDSKHASIEVIDPWIPLCFRPPMEIENLFLSRITVFDEGSNQLWGEIGIITSSVIHYGELTPFQIFTSRFQKQFCKVQAGTMPIRISLGNFERLEKLQPEIWKLAINRAYNSSLEMNEAFTKKSYYWITPLTGDQIDWDLIEQVINNSTNNLASMLKSQADAQDISLKDLIVTATGSHKIYQNLQLVVDSNISPNDAELNQSKRSTLVRAEEISKIRNLLSFHEHETPIKIKTNTFPVKELNVLSVTPKLTAMIQMIPSIVYKLEVVGRANDTMNKVYAHEMPLDDILPAFYASTAENDLNYERLEILGDSFLKFAATVYIVTMSPNAPVGKWSSARSKIISNENLYSTCKMLGLEGMLELQPFDPQWWVPPIYNIETKNRVVSRKKLADFLEAIIGAYYHSLGHDTAWDLLSRLKIIPSLVKQVNLKEKPGTLLSDQEIRDLERKIGYHFGDPQLLSLCFMHTSATNTTYDKLEFLGDAILDFTMMDYFFNSHTGIQPGELAVLKSSSVNNEFLGYICAQLELEKHLVATDAIKTEIANFTAELGDSFERDNEAPKVLADIIEAIIGAVYIDSVGDYEQTREVITFMMGEYIDLYCNPSNQQKCPMRLLNEALQALRADPRESISYSFDQEFSAHTCHITFMGRLIAGAKGNTTKTCKRRAARLAAKWLTDNFDLALKMKEY